MPIDNTYQKILLEKYIREQALNGEVLSLSDIQDFIDETIVGTDFTKPQFKAADYKVVSGETSSVAKYSNTINAVLSDVKTLCQELQRLSEYAINQYERWHTDIESLDAVLHSLNSRVGDLALLAQNIEGYLSFIAERFVDMSMVDPDLTTVAVNTTMHVATMDPTISSLLPLAVNLTDDDIFLKIISKTGIALKGSAGGKILDAFNRKDTIWQTKIQTTEQEPVTVEIKVKLADTPVEVSRIEFATFASNTMSPMVITPLYSTDGYNWAQLSNSNIVQQAVSVATFSFAATEMLYLKLLLSKSAADTAENNQFVYEFGARSIQLFRETFEFAGTEARQLLVSEPLSVLDPQNGVVEFSKLALDACEVIPADTAINYFVAVSNSGLFPVTTSTIWSAIDPSGRTERENPLVLNVGDLTSMILGDTETVVPSYDAFATDGEVASGLKNPAPSFYLIGEGISGDLESETITAAVNRYPMVNSSDRALNYQLKSPSNPDVVEIDPTYFLIDPSSLVIYRNVGERGIDTSVAGSKVRGIQRGWGFEDPYYFCVVNVIGDRGLYLDVGPNNIWVDEIARNGKQVFLATGFHNVRVHKNNWFYVPPEIAYLATLKAADPLYPYNQKLLIEGYDYAAGFDYPEFEIYTGVDFFAEYTMKKMRIFDFLHTIPASDFVHFATDYDLPDSYSNTYGNMLFLVKVDENLSDAQNEKFRIEFHTVDQKYKYIRLKAEFVTESPDVTPMLTGYKIRIG
jgi:hypothetical protein